MPIPVVFRFAGYGGPFLASIVTARKAPHDRVFLAILIAPPAVLLQRASWAAYEATGGHVDSVGMVGELIVMLFSLSLTVFICAVGGLLGSLLAGRRAEVSRLGNGINGRRLG